MLLTLVQSVGDQEVSQEQVQSNVHFVMELEWRQSVLDLSSWGLRVEGVLEPKCIYLNHAWSVKAKALLYKERK